MKALFVALVLASPAIADCKSQDYNGASYTWCEADAGQDVRLFLKGEDGEVLGSFNRVNEEVGGRLVFAMNAGMYHPERRPVGLYVEDGDAQAKLITKDTSGNFGLLPNGVFCIADQGFAVIESRRFATEKPACRYASQSGPMLVIDGALHPKFLQGSTYTNIRNGVGVSADGTRAVFVISNDAVNFWDFAVFMRDGLDLPNALYFDGTISRLYAPEIDRNDRGFQMGPIVGLVAPN